MQCVFIFSWQCFMRLPVRLLFARAWRWRVAVAPPCGCCVSDEFAKLHVASCRPCRDASGYGIPATIRVTGSQPRQPPRCFGLRDTPAMLRATENRADTPTHASKKKRRRRRRRDVVRITRSIRENRPSDIFVYLFRTYKIF